MHSPARIQNSLIAVGFLLLASFLGLYFLGNAEISSTRAAASVEHARTSFDLLLSTIKDAETGQRGFLLTRNSDYLAPFRGAMEGVHSRLDEAITLGQGVGVDPHDLARMKTLVTQKFDELNQTIVLDRAGHPEAAVAVVRNGEGKKMMDELRQLVAKIDAQQDLAIRTLNEQNRSYVNVRTILFAFATVLSLVSLGWAFQRIRADFAAQQRAAAELFEQRELLDVTLRCIGDGVIITDSKGIINFLNPVASELTGWTAEEAAGCPCGEIFVIINEETRETVESPVDKVIETGSTVMLANHTVLVRRDKIELPIEDSAAPILDPERGFLGVVLIFRDFSAHRDLEKSLRAAKHSAEAASRAKDTFLASLSHELRTPLTPVVATLSSWQSAENLPDKVMRDVDMLRRSISLEVRLIDDLLDLTRITEGKLSLANETADLHDLVSQTVEMCASEALGHGLKVELALAAKNHHVYGDTGRLQQVIWNILRNAIKFTPKGGRIKVTTTDHGPEEIELQIEDTGIGMTPSTLERVFDAFEQGSSEVNRRFGGLGLGMAITKSLVEAHHGEIKAWSKGPGEGSTFVVDLPTVSAAEKQSEPPRESTEGTTLRPLSILLVEDHVDSATVIAQLLEFKGHSVVIAGTVAEGIEQSSQHSFDIVLSDLGLPDGSGIDFIQQFRALQGDAVPAVALTGYGMEDNIQQSLDAGFTKHLTKPVDFSRLMLVIGQLTTSSPYSA